jgi:hypothetical protein
MKTYPSILKTWFSGVNYFVFDKLDGSNVRAEWSKQKGFYKYGSRRQLIDESHLTLGQAPPLIREKYEDDLGRIFKKKRIERAVVFFEFHGPLSFAGNHAPGDDLTVTLFDVDVYRKGLTPPKEFLATYGHLDIPTLLYEGRFNNDLKNQVQVCELDGITFEGVVGKGFKPGKKSNVPTMFKVKTHQWLDKLKDFCDGDSALYRRLV